MKAGPVNSILSVSDPVFRLMYKCLRPSPALAALLLPVLLGMPMVLAALWERGFISPILRVDMAHDLGLWVSLSVIPLFLLYSRSLYNSFPKTLDGLFANRVIVTDRQDFHSSISRWYSWFGSRLLTLVIYGISVVLFILQTVQGHLNRDNSWSWPDTWQTPTPSAFLSFPIFAISLYLAVQLSVRLLLIGFLTARTCTVFKVRVHILHPDGSGGLAPLGRFVMQLNILVLIASVIVVATLYSQVFLFRQSIYAPLQLVTIVSHFVLSAALVFTPTIAAHRKMTKARDEFLSTLCAKFENEDQKFRSALELDSPIDIANVQRLNAIKAFFDIAKAQPVWPFNMKVVYSFLGSVIWPLLFFILQTLTEKVYPASH